MQGMARRYFRLDYNGEFDLITLLPRRALYIDTSYSQVHCRTLSLLTHPFETLYRFLSRIFLRGENKEVWISMVETLSIIAKLYLYVSTIL